MALSLKELSAIVQEIGEALGGALIQKIHQPSPHSITLEIRKPAQSHTLLLCADSQTARLHFIQDRLSNPKTPPSFCALLRRHIQGSKISGVDQTPGDRIVTLNLNSANKDYFLIAALIGRNSNIVLIDHNRTVLGSLKPPLAKIGQPYVPPEKPAASLKTHDTKEAGESHDSPEKNDPTRPFPLSLALEKRYSQKKEELDQAQAFQTQITAIRKTIKKTQRRIDAYSSDLEKIGRYREYKRYGELLKSQITAMKPGQKDITVADYFDPKLPELLIPLDPSKGPRANMEDYFGKYRKFVGAEKELRPRLEQSQQELQKLKETLHLAEKGELAQLLPSPLSPQRATPSQQPGSPKLSSPSGPFRRFLSVDGFPILLGKTARHNEELTFGVAKDHDLWLHARGTPGSHVVVSLEKRVTPPPETLRDAATLALQYSDLRKSGKGEVIYTLKRYVRKAKGQKAGAVTITREKGIWIILHAERLERLKNSIA